VSTANFSAFYEKFTKIGMDDTAPPAGLQLLTDRHAPEDILAVEQCVQLFHHELTNAKVEWLSVQEMALPSENPGPPLDYLGLISWGKHVVKVMAFNSPMPSPPLSRTLAHTQFVPQQIKEVAGKHKAHWLFDYAGKEEHPTERFAATAMIVGAIANFGGIVALNEEARACIPASALQPENDDEDIMQVLRELPIPYLYGGFAKMELSDPPGAVWYRTFQNARFGLPNLAMAGAHDSFTNTFQLFTALLKYLDQTKLEIAVGEKIRVDEDNYYQTRQPSEAEWYLDSEQGYTIVLTKAEEK
jgi:hypothetical protein